MTSAAISGRQSDDSDRLYSRNVELSAKLDFRLPLVQEALSLSLSRANLQASAAVRGSRSGARGAQEENKSRNQGYLSLSTALKSVSVLDLLRSAANCLNSKVFGHYHNCARSLAANSIFLWVSSSQESEAAFESCRLR